MGHLLYIPMCTLEELNIASGQLLGHQLTAIQQKVREDLKNGMSSLDEILILLLQKIPQ